MNINIPEPCHEDWVQMTPNEQGRFCGSCQKTVVDFTNFSAVDIQNYFTKHYEQKVCGRFKNQQLNAIDIQIPRAIIYHIPASRRFALALLIVFGTTLFSCTDNNGNHAAISKIEVVDSLVKNNSDTLTTLDSIELATITSAPQILTGAVLTSPTKNKIKRKQNNILQNSEIGITRESHNDDGSYTTGIVEEKIDTNIVIGVIELMPEFIGGEDSLYSFIESNLTTPKNLIQENIKGKIVIRFFVEIDGSITGVELLKGIGNDWDKEAIRLVKSMPKWNPGSIYGKPTRLGMILPIKIGE
jgi:hypothetical protein